jgi:phosphoribosylaminoimidazolecarboxamide formyltransferase / IMP cyclohydrolase
MNMAGNIVPVQYALLSVTNKDGLVELARSLSESKVELYSTGGTAKAIRDAKLPVNEVADYTQWPEMFNGRVKTLHPRVAGGILYRRDVPEDVQVASEQGIVPFNLVVVNLYRVQQAIGKTDASVASVMEETDIGGPTMIRAAAKNHAHVGVVVDPEDYTAVARQILNTGGLDDDTRLVLATKVFKLTANYDDAIGYFLRQQVQAKGLEMRVR